MPHQSNKQKQSIKLRKHLSERAFQTVLYIASLSVIIFLVGIIYSIFRAGLPVFGSVTFTRFIFHNAWYPTQAIPEYGTGALIAGSFALTAGALLIAIPLGLGSAIYISEVAGMKSKEIIKPIIELLAGIPSVVYGLFGMAFLAPLIRQLLHLNTGLNLFTCSIILGIMVVPIIASMSEDALNAVPKQLREASLALGATQWETITRVTVPAAMRGITGSILLGFGRAIGETMVVLMVAGGAARIPHSVFDPVRPMTATIAAEMGETVTGSIHYQALFGIAIILFVITLITNLITQAVFKREA